MYITIWHRELIHVIQPGYVHGAPVYDLDIVKQFYPVPQTDNEILKWLIMPSYREERGLRVLVARRWLQALQYDAYVMNTHQAEEAINKLDVVLGYMEHDDKNVLSMLEKIVLGMDEKNAIMQTVEGLFFPPEPYESQVQMHRNQYSFCLRKGSAGDPQSTFDGIKGFGKKTDSNGKRLLLTDDHWKHITDMMHRWVVLVVSDPEDVLKQTISVTMVPSFQS